MRSTLFLPNDKKVNEKDINNSLDALLQQVTAEKLPPVEKWNPPYTGDSAIVIRANGDWYHEGGLIKRPALVRLFSSILRRDADGRIMLVTPVEKQSVTVEDAPFVATEVESEGEGEQRVLGFRLNTGEAVIAGPQHPISLVMEDMGPKPYVLVRPGLQALITRPAFYQLAEWAVFEENTPLGLWSHKQFFVLDDEN